MDDIEFLIKSTSSASNSDTSSTLGYNQRLTRWKSKENFNYNRDNYSRSRSLTQFSIESYTPGEILKIRERLLRTHPGIERSIFKHFSRNQKMTLLSLALVDFMCFCSMSLMAPFFPKEAAEKGLSNTLSGFVFSFYALIMFISSPIFGKILPILGAKFLFLSGIILTGTCNILFGLLEYVEDYTLFVSLCFVIRGFEAVGASAFSTASYVFVVHSFPEKIGSVLGILETFVGLGMSVGPAIGIAMITIVPLNAYLLPPVNDFVVGNAGGSIKKLLQVPAVIITSGVVVVVSCVWAFLDPTLEPHLRELNLSSEQIGLIFLLFSALYGISSPFWGWLTDKLNNHWSMMIWGMLFSSFALLLLGPFPYIPFLQNTLWLNLVALSLLGVFVALALLPTFQSLLKSAIDGGCDDSLATYSLVAGLWSGIYSLGEVIGPSVGGILLDQYGFVVCSTVMAVVVFMMAFISCTFFCIKNQYSRNYSKYYSSESGINECWEEKESTALLKSNTSSTYRSYMAKKVQHYEQSRKMEHRFGNFDKNQVTDIRGTIAITPRGACEI